MKEVSEEMLKKFCSSCGMPSHDNGAGSKVGPIIEEVD